jgi:hypothetical protein
VGGYPLSLVDVRKESASLPRTPITALE